MVINRLAGAACALALSASAAGTVLAEEVSCPQPIPVKESLDQPPPEGWTPRTDASPRYLMGVTFFDGDPAEMRSLAPTRDVATSRRERVAVWRFGAGGEPVWLTCRYLDSGVTLSRPLPAGYRSCRVSYGPGGIVKAIECK